MELYWYNFLIYLSIFIFSIIKNKNNIYFSWIWLVYSISSLTTIYYIINSETSITHPIIFSPFLYLIINLLLMTYPLLNLGYNNLNYEKLSRTKNKSFIFDTLPLICCIILLPPLIENIFLATSISTSSLGNIYERGESSELSQRLYMRLSWYSRNANRLVNVLFYIVPFLLFKELSNLQLRWKQLIACTFMILNFILTSYNNAARTDILKLGLCIIIYFIIFKPLIPTKRLVYLKFFILTAGGIFILLLMFITISRLNNFTHDVDIFTWMSLYTGESFLRFSDLMWYKNADMLGDNCFPLIKSILGMPTFTDPSSRQLFWEPKLGIPNNIFYTYIGDIFADFGFFITIIYSLIIGYIIKRISKSMKKRLYFYQITLLALLLLPLFFGFMHFVYKIYGDQIRMLSLLIFSLILYYTEKNRKLSNKNVK